jgi:predicted TIM-barrel fold metal-dependent hydrolase
MALHLEGWPDVMSAAQELAAGLDDDEQDEVFGRTTARIYRLPEARSRRT